MEGVILDDSPLVDTVPLDDSPLADTVPRWFAGIRHDREIITSDLPQWSDWTLSQALLVRQLKGGSVGAEIFEVGRFRRRDWGIALDGYKDLWERAYGNLQIRATPGAEVVPRADVRLEVFQAFPSGWEVSGSYRRMDFDTDDVDLVGAAVARYVGNWYLREVTTVSTLAGRAAFSFSAMARRLLSPPWEYVEVAGGLGREVMVLGSGPTVDVRETRFLQGRIQKFLHGDWGLSAGVAYHRFEGAPQRRGLSLGLITRF